MCKPQTNLMIGVAWLCSNAICMYAIVILNTNYGSLCMCY